MRCDEFLGAIDAYFDDELSIMDILRVHRHLLSCECCYRVMGSEAALHSLLADDAAGGQPPRSLRRRIIRRVAAQESTGSSRARSKARSRREPFASLPSVVAGRLRQASSSRSRDLQKQEPGGPDTSRS